VGKKEKEKTQELPDGKGNGMHEGKSLGKKYGGPKGGTKNLEFVPPWALWEPSTRGNKTVEK